MSNVMGFLQVIYNVTHPSKGSLTFVCGTRGQANAQHRCGHIEQTFVAIGDSSIKHGAVGELSTLYLRTEQKP